MVELELKRRDLLVGSTLTDSSYLRDQITGLCHDARDELNRKEMREREENKPSLGV
jgi:hypothetical protein